MDARETGGTSHRSSAGHHVRQCAHHCEIRPACPGTGPIMRQSYGFRQYCDQCGGRPNRHLAQPTRHKFDHRQRITSIHRAMRAALDDASLSPQELDCISASANGSIQIDKDEAFAIRALFNGSGPEISITAIKSMTGETLGASGALQAIDLIETMRSGVLPGIRGLEQKDPLL